MPGLVPGIQKRHAPVAMTGQAVALPIGGGMARPSKFIIRHRRACCAPIALTHFQSLPPWIAGIPGTSPRTGKPGNDELLG